MWDSYHGSDGLCRGRIDANAVLPCRSSKTCAPCRCSKRSPKTVSASWSIAFRVIKHPAGTTLFAAGEIAQKFEILQSGEVIIEEISTDDHAQAAAAGTRLTLRNLAPLGELGALTGLPRSTTATAKTDVEVLSISISDLLGFFDKNADVGLSFYKSLLEMVADKIRRDRSRLDDMRTNLVKTQKAMKKMREQIEEAEEERDLEADLRHARSTHQQQPPRELPRLADRVVPRARPPRTTARPCRSSSCPRAT